MIRNIASIGSILFGFVLATGCAQVPKEAGFGDVQKIVGQRLDHRLHWNQGTEADTKVTKVVEQLVA